MNSGKQHILATIAAACMLMVGACSKETTPSEATAANGAGDNTGSVVSEQAPIGDVHQTVAPAAATEDRAVKTGCEADGAWVHARWAITLDIDGEGEMPAASRTLDMWRGDRFVAYTDAQNQITEVWLRTANDRVKLDRYFDAHKRAIEYQPGDYDDAGVSWSAHYQIVPQGFLDTQTPVASEGEGCEQVDRYLIESEGETIELSWRPNLRLIAAQTIRRDNYLQTWVLETLETGKALVESELATRTNFQTTDYADIGDNESDPFLMRMIELGFIEHGASGFYTSDGEQIGEGGHGHSHH